MRLEGIAKGGFYPTPPTVTELIASHVRADWQGIRTKERPQFCARILDPCCGDGVALQTFAQKMRHTTDLKIQTFGIELHEGRAQQAKERLDHVLHSDLFATMVANEEFSVLYLNPPYDHDAEKKRAEHAFLTRCTRYLPPGGLLIFIVPRNRVKVSIRYLATQYRQVKMHYFPQPERDSFDQVVVFGRKKSEPSVSRETENTLVEETVTRFPETLKRDAYASIYPELVANHEVMFTTSRTDPLRLSAEAAITGLWSKPDIRDSLWPETRATTRPLMPLRRGHIALLIAAGFLDNLELESPSGQRILVKGRTTKKMELVETDEENDVERYIEKMVTTVVSIDLDSGAIDDIT